MITTGASYDFSFHVPGISIKDVQATAEETRMHMQEQVLELLGGERILVQFAGDSNDLRNIKVLTEIIADTTVIDEIVADLNCDQDGDLVVDHTYQNTTNTRMSRISISRIVSSYLRVLTYLHALSACLSACFAAMPTLWAAAVLEVLFFIVLHVPCLILYCSGMPRSRRSLECV